MIWPSGVTSAGIAAGIKDGGAPDLGLIVCDRPLVWSGTFTTNAAAAAPVLWSRGRLGRPVRALVVNSGNANACTGPAGEEAVRATARAISAIVGCNADEVLVASTGPIGVPLPVDRVIAGLPACGEGLSADPTAFASAILTTDTSLKMAEAAAGEARVVGVAKGAAMVAPGMATMLAFIVTDASAPEDMDEILRGSVDRTFNRISVDGCASTNDSVYLFATGAAGRPDPAAFRAAVESICSDLAWQIVGDAEGGSKVIEVNVESARDEGEALTFARAVVDSNLWRAAAHGNDPNWGRILSALGTVDPALKIEKVTIAIGPEIVFAAGAPTGSLDVAAKAMAEPVFAVTCDLGRGRSAASLLTADLSPDYVKLNAEGST